MPSLSAVPAAPPVWDLDASYPTADSNTDFGGGGFFGSPAQDGWCYRESGRATGNAIAGNGVSWAGPGAGGGGVTSRFQTFGGVAYCWRVDTTAALQGSVFRPPVWINCYDPGAAAGGMVSREDMRAFWWREVWLWTGFGDAGNGNVFSWDVAGVGGVNWAQAGAAVLQHGVFGNGAGGLEYRCYSAAPALVDQVAIPGVAVNAWILFDHQFIAWAPGRSPTYELRVNGTRVVQRTFGTAQLPYPGTGGLRLQYVQRRNATAGQTYLAYIRARAGRFTMDGAEVRT